MQNSKTLKGQQKRKSRWCWIWVAQMVKHLPKMQETWVQSLGQKDLLGKKIATHSSILAWKFPWTEEPGRLQSTGSQRAGHNRATEHTHTQEMDNLISWKRDWISWVLIAFKYLELYLEKNREVCLKAHCGFIHFTESFWLFHRQKCCWSELNKTDSLGHKTVLNSGLYRQEAHWWHW